MCGLFGWQFRKGTVSQETKDYLLLSLAGSMDNRGGHSWGLFNPQGLESRGLGKMSDSLGWDAKLPDCLVGHTRFATTGDVNTDNCHPFRCGRVLGAHNGMVTNHDELNLTYDRDCTVDSQHIFRHLDEGYPLPEIEAYGAVCFTVDGYDRVFLGRFNDGELSVAAVRGGLVWASTWTALTDALTLAGLKGRWRAVKEGRLHYCDNGRLYRSEGQLDFADPWRAPARSPLRWKFSWDDEKTDDYDWNDDSARDYNLYLNQ